MIFMESFDWINQQDSPWAGQCAGIWAEALGEGTLNKHLRTVASVNGGPDGTGGTSLAAGSGQQNYFRGGIRHDLNVSPLTTMSYSLWVYYTSSPFGFIICRFYNDVVSAINTLGMNASLRPFISRSSRADAAQIVSQSTNLITLNAWNHIAVLQTFSQSVGTVDWWINGIASGSDTGLDSSLSSNLGCKTLFMSPIGGASGSPYYFSNNAEYTMICVGTTGNPGDCEELVVKARRPSADGVISDFTPVTGPNNWDELDDKPLDDAQYNGSAVSADRDLFDVPNIIDAGSVAAVQVNARAQKETAGGKNLKIVMKDGAPEIVGPAFGLTAGTPATGYLISNTKPAGGAWDQATVNSAEYGYEVA